MKIKLTFLSLALSAVVFNCTKEEVTTESLPLNQTKTTVASEKKTNSSAKVAAPSALDINFQGYNDGATYSTANASSDFQFPSTESWDGSPSQKIKQYDTRGYKGLRCQLTGGQIGNAGGMINNKDLSGSKDYTMEYKVYFEPGFEFSQGNSTNINGGGKLPGLAGGSRPSGCVPKSDGFSARIMWRKDNQRYPSTSNGGYLELYQYWRGQGDVCGDRIPLQGCEAGKWYTIKIRVKLGTSTSNGSTEVWINGVLRHSKSYRFLGSTDNWNINGVMMHTFYGGNDSTWAPLSTRYLILDNIRVDKIAF